MCNHKKIADFLGEVIEAYKSGNDLQLPADITDWRSSLILLHARESYNHELEERVYKSKLWSYLCQSPQATTFELICKATAFASGWYHAANGGVTVNFGLRMNTALEKNNIEGGRVFLAKYLKEQIDQAIENGEGPVSIEPVPLQTALGEITLSDDGSET